MNRERMVYFVLFILVVANLILAINAWDSGTETADEDRRYVCGYNAPKVPVFCDYPLEPAIDTWGKK